MQFVLGVSIFSVPNRDPAILFDFIDQHNIEAIELWDITLSGTKNCSSIAIRAKEKHVSLHGPLLDLGDSASSEENISRFHTTIENASIIGARTLVMHLGDLPGHDEDNRSDGLDTAREVINDSLYLLKDSGIKLCIENTGYTGMDLISCYDDLLDFVSSFPRELVSVTFDFAHANITEDVENGIDLLKDRIAHIHISDNLRDIDNHHLPLGEGNIDFGLLSRIRGDEKVGIILEITPTWDWKNNILRAIDKIQGLRLLE